MTTQPLRIGVVGVGFGAQVHIPAFQSEGMDVVAVCARHEDRANEAAKRFGIRGRTRSTTRTHVTRWQEGE